MSKIVYKDNVIRTLSSGRVVFFLCDADGCIYSHNATSVDDAKAQIDGIESRQGGLYNLDGELV